MSGSGAAIGMMPSIIPTHEKKTQEVRKEVNIAYGGEEVGTTWQYHFAVPVVKKTRPLNATVTLASASVVI